MDVTQLAVSLPLLFYLAGVIRAWLHAGVGRGIGLLRALAGVLGLAALGLVLSPPFELLAATRFSGHMAQHLLIVLVVAPGLVIGQPGVALLWLLPADRRRALVRGWRRTRVGPSAARLLVSPVPAATLFALVLWGWHLPVAYQMAVEVPALHVAEHASLLAAAILLWWTVLRPTGARRAGWLAAPLTLFASALHGGLLGMMLTLAEEPWYPLYQRSARALGYDALADQQLAGLLMWVPPGAVYLSVACWLLYRGLGMEARRRRVAGSLPLACLFVAVISAGTLGDAQVLEPAGPAARQVAEYFGVMLVIAAAVVLLVYLLFFTAIFRSRAPGRERVPLGDGPFVVLLGVVMPVVVLVPLLVWSLRLTAGANEGDGQPLVIEVTGHQWWWEVHYPEHEITDANEIHVPVGVPVQLRLTSQDVIHSFWAPGLQGKMDLIPGDENSLWLQADEVGVHEAKCAEYCGTQHANMRLLVVSEPTEGFEAWLEGRRQASSRPASELEQRGQDIFLSSPCVGCHTIEGTAAAGTIGPDLTHVGSRLTLGAGTVANNAGNMAGWIANAQGIKPGNHMPPMPLEAEELQALLAYLRSLE